MRPIQLALALLTLAMPATMAAGAETPTLNVLTYDSFAADWGPGPVLAKGFEETCSCKVHYVTAGDGAAVLARLKLEGKKTTADVVVGLDTSLTGDAKATGLFAPTGLAPKNDLPVAFSDKTLLPYDWGWLAFVYNKSKVPNPPHSFPELAASKLKVVIEDPRSSTPGLGLVMWVKKAYGDKAPEIWRSLADNILTVTPSWDAAYGMFTKGEADMVLSYTTDPAYQQIVEKADTTGAAIFKEGQYMQVEVAGMVKTSKHPALARQFLQFLLSQDFQKAIPTTNWMLPVVDIGADLPPAFHDLPKPTKALLLPSDQVAASREAWIKEWLNVVGQ